MTQQRTPVCAPVVALAATLLVGCAPKKEVLEARLRYAHIPTDAYAVVADIRAKPGKADELRRATLPLVAQVRNEPNNRLYFLHEYRKEPGHFVFYEIFASQADFDAHNATPHVQSWFGRLSALAEGDVNVVRLQILGNESGSAK
jgi:quinol monooxygenase YgiN